MRAAAVVAAAVVVLVGCGGDSDSDSDSAAPTATVPKATTTSPSTTAVALDDWEGVMRQILTRRDEAYEQNKPEYLDEIYLPQCKCLAGEKADIQKQIADGVHTAGERLRVLKVELINTIGSTGATVRVVYEQGPHRLVNSSGEVVREEATEPPTSLVFTIGLSDGRWKVERILLEGPVNGSAAP